MRGLYVCYIGTSTGEVGFSVDEWEKMSRREFTLTGSWMSCSAPFLGRDERPSRVSSRLVSSGTRGLCSRPSR
mgnify:CR=1 FL=1